MKPPFYYLVDEAFGPAFVKISAYFPYPIKIWLNGHEYAKHQAKAEGIGFTELANGFAATEDPAGLQRICGMLGSGTIRMFCERWWARLPLPLSEADWAAAVLALASLPQANLGGLIIGMLLDLVGASLAISWRTHPIGGPLLLLALLFALAANTTSGRALKPATVAPLANHKPQTTGPN